MRWLVVMLLGCQGSVGGSPGVDTSDASVRDASVRDAGVSPPSRGAIVPWIEYEAEDGTTTGEIVGPGRAPGTPAGEASGRRAVILDAPGEHVTWTVARDANAIVVRYSLPDAPGGGGIDGTLGLYVDGVKRASLALSSRQAWIYGDDATQVDHPSAGPPRRIYTETHRLLDPGIAAGASLSLRVDAGDTAPTYAIDFIDLEDVAPPLSRPPGFVSITDGGHPWPAAVADDGRPDDQAIQQCLDAARAGQFAGVYLPPGTFDHQHKLRVAGATVQGAGMWHTTLYNADLTEDPGPGQTGFLITGGGATFRDFAIVGNTGGLRHQGGKAWVGPAFDDTRIENMWVENVQCGYWVGGAAPSSRLVIRNSRFRNTGADAVNLCNGARDSVLENNHARNTGDDAFAIWSATDLYPQPATGNVIRRSTVQITWRAAAFAIYGGTDNRIEDSVAYDTLTYPGLTVSSEFQPFPLVSATVENLTLVRTGGTYWGGQEFGSIWVRADQDPIRGITLRHLDVIDPAHQGIHVQGDGGALHDVLIEDVTITRPRTYGVQVQAGAAGRATFRDVTVIDPGVAGIVNQAPATFTVDDGGGNRW